MLDALEHGVQAVDARAPRRVVPRPALPATALERVGLVGAGRVAPRALQRQPGVAIEHVRRDIGVAGRQENEHIGRGVVELSGGQQLLLEDDELEDELDDELELLDELEDELEEELEEELLLLEDDEEELDEELELWLDELDDASLL